MQKIQKLTKELQCLNLNNKLKYSIIQKSRQ